jgi:predicted ATPase/DNA-binding SARP family transcriptional activator
VPLTIRLLGPFEVLVGGRPVDVSGPKHQALVALLALRGGRVVTVDTIVDALWGEDVPADPANALQHHVSRLRKALGPEALVASPDGYALRDAEVDVLRLEELLSEVRAALRGGDALAAAAAADEALALWAGRPLLGLPEALWVSAEQARLEALRLDVLEERFAAMLALGEHATVVPELREAVAANPFRERLWQQLMLALYRAGRQADALEAFQAARRILADELGLEPGPDLQGLQAAILAHDPAIAAVPVRRRPRGNLPAAVASFVGREELLGEVERLVRKQRLVTLTGPPGVGKTRLALEAAHAVEPDFAGGVWFVDLRRARVSADVARLTARVVEAPRSPATGNALRRVAHRLENADALLVLDECERFLGDVAGLASAVLSECPGVRVLATSREALRLPGEHRIHVPPLAVPQKGGGDDPLDSEAVQLFLERGRATKPGFRATAAESMLVADICRAVDGLPAAIELAAARTNVIGLRELLTDVERLLASFRAHQLSEDAEGFLSTLVGWSYDLLHAEEKTVLHQLAVFRGGAARDALLAMSAQLQLDGPTTIRLLETLVDKSIVTVSFPDGDARYDLLTTVREYVLERLAESGDLEETKLAHARSFAALADRAGSALRTRDYGTWHVRLTRDYDNLWTALGYACDTSDAELAQRLALGCAWYFVYTNRISAGRAFVERALAAGDRSASARSLELLGHLTYFALVELDLETAVATGEEALSVAAAVDAPREKAYAEAELAYALGIAGERPRAEALLASARRGMEALGEEWYVAGCDFIAAIIAARAGDVDAVAARADALVSQSRALEYDPWLPPAMLIQAWVAGKRGDRRTEARGYRDVLSGFAGDPWVSTIALAGLAEGALVAGDPDEARTLARQAVRNAKQADSPWLAAHARLTLARAVAATGDLVEAGRLYELVAGWAQGERNHERIELFFAPLVGSPGSRALLALAELAEAEPDEAWAISLRERALAVAEADHVPFQPTLQPQTALS